MNTDKSTSKGTNQKRKYWTFIVYPESAPDEWMSMLAQTGLQIAVSPLHDSDKNPDGAVKKSHYHVIAAWTNSTTYNTVKNLTDSLNAPIPKALDAPKGMYRYFSHKDNPEKFQYDEKDIKHLNGFNILDMVELAKSEVMQIKKELQKIIIENSITEYSDLMDLVMFEMSDNYYDVASGNTYFFSAYIGSKRNRLREEMMSAPKVAKIENVKVDTETGEIIE